MAKVKGPTSRSTFWLIWLNMPLDFDGHDSGKSSLVKSMSFWHLPLCIFTPAPSLLRVLTFCLPFILKSRVCLVTIDTCLRIMWPIHPHFFILISIPIRTCFVLSHLVGDDFRPPDVEDVPEASIDGGLEFVSVGFGFPPCLWTIN